MAVDYVLQYPCEVRRIVPEAKLLAMVRYQSIAEFSLNKFKDAYPQYDRTTILNKYTVEISVRGPDGAAKETPVTIAQLLSMTAPLEEVKSNCANCRANVADRSFGCIGKINYPIASVSENWLLSRLPENPKSPSLGLLLKFLGDLDIDGAPVDQFRVRGGMFDLKSPISRNWGAWFSKNTISSSQILHMLAFGGNIGPQQAQLYTKLLDLTSVLSDPHPPSANVEQFKTFMCAIVMAGRLNSTLAVDA